MPVPLGKCPQRMQEFFENTWDSLGRIVNCPGMEICTFLASLMGANCWVNRQVLWNSLEPSSLEIQQQIEVEAVIQWLSWARSKSPF